METKKPGGLAAARLLFKAYHVSPRLQTSRKDVIFIGLSKNGKVMGRPYTGDEPKDKRISLRATQTTVIKFDECSKQLEKSKTDLLEQMVDDLFDKVCKK